MANFLLATGYYPMVTDFPLPGMANLAVMANFLLATGYYLMVTDFPLPGWRTSCWRRAIIRW